MEKSAWEIEPGTEVIVLTDGDKSFRGTLAEVSDGAEEVRLSNVRYKDEDFSAVWISTDTIEAVLMP